MSQLKRSYVMEGRRSLGGQEESWRAGGAKEGRRSQGGEEVSLTHLARTGRPQVTEGSASHACNNNM